MKASRTLIAVAIAAALPLGAAVAADNDQYGKEKDKSMMPDSSFKKLDANGDGRISQAEAAADSTIVFSTADANGDGYLDNDEWKASTKGSAKPSRDSSSRTAHHRLPRTGHHSAARHGNPAAIDLPRTFDVGRPRGRSGRAGICLGQRLR